SDDGNIVVFATRGAFVAGDTNVCANDAMANAPCSDVYVHDRASGQTMRISVSSDGTQGNDASFAPSVSADGRYVLFTSLASNLVANDTNGASDAFIHDRLLHTTTRVSLGNGGAQGASASTGAVLSKNGQVMAFLAAANAFGSPADPE